MALKRPSISINSKTLTVDESATFNENSVTDGDFRVESDSKTHMLFVDSSLDRVGVGTDTPGAALGIDGDIKLVPTVISTAHIDATGSLDIRCTNNMKLGTNDADSIRIGRDNTTEAKVHIRSGSDADLVVANGKVGIGMEDPSDALEIDGDIQLSPTAISTAHVKTAGSLKVRATGNMHIGDDGVDSIRIGRDNSTAAKVHLRSGADTDLVVTNRKVGIGTDDPKTDLTVEGTITLKEQAAADGDTAAYGQLWVKTATPNELYFTTDAGDDIQITSGTTTAFVGDITGVSAGVGLSGGGTSGDVTLTLDLSELSAVTPTATDSFATLDSDGATEQRTTITALSTFLAGAHASTGLAASSGVLSVVDLHAVGVDGANNQLLTDNGDGSVSSEGNLSFDGSTLAVTGAMTTTTTATVGTDLTVTGGDISYGNGQHATMSVAAVSGTNATGKNLTISAGAGTGTGDGGSIFFQTAPAGSSGSTAGTLTNALTIDEDGVAHFLGDVIVGGTTPKLTIGDAGAEDTMLVFDGNAQDYRIGLDDGTDTLEIGVGAAHGTTPAITINSSANTTFSGTVTANAGVSVDNTSLDAGTLTQSSGDFTVDGAADIILDAAGSNVTMKVDGTTFADFIKTSIETDTTYANSLHLDCAGVIKLDSHGGNIIFAKAGTSKLSITADTNSTISPSGNAANDVIFTDGDESGVEIFRVDGSENSILMASAKKIEFGDAGTFIHQSADGKLKAASDGTGADGVIIDSAGGLTIDCDAAAHGITYADGGTALLKINNDASSVEMITQVSDKDLIFKGNDGGSTITALTLDMSEAGKATFNGDVVVSGGDISFGNGQNATIDVRYTAHDTAGKSLTISAGDTTAGTTNNIAGGDLIFQGGQGKGTGDGGDIVFKVAKAGTSGSSLNSLMTAMTIKQDTSVAFDGAITHFVNIVTCDPSGHGTFGSPTLELNATQSGSTVLVDTGTYDVVIKLPSPSAGLYYKVMLGRDSVNEFANQCVVTTGSDSVDFIGHVLHGMVTQAAAGGIVSNTSANTQGTNLSALGWVGGDDTDGDGTPDSQTYVQKCGDWLSFLCDGSHWIVDGKAFNNASFAGNASWNSFTGVGS